MDIVGFLIASVVITLMPGPDILFVMSQSLMRGSRAGISVALGLCSGLAVHTLAVALGVAVLVRQSPMLFQIIKFAGVAYLTYMGICSIIEMRRAAKRSNEKTEELAPTKSLKSLYKTGIIMNILNPKVAIFFLSFMPQFIDGQSNTISTDLLILCSLFALQAVVVFTLVSFAAGWLSNRLSIDTVSGRNMALIKAVVYLLIALLFLFQ